MVAAWKTHAAEQGLKRKLLQELEGIEHTEALPAREAHAVDASGEPPVLPDILAFPRSTGEVQKVIRACVRHQVPITPMGALTGKSGGAIPIRGGLGLSFERMQRILRVSGKDGVAEVEPGVILGDLHREVERQGLFYPPDPNSWESCSIGGNIAENAGGPRALKYGVTRDYVLGLTWVTPTGEVLEVGRRTHKGVAGYDLTGLFVGSEGTLGVATRIALKLLPLPPFVKAGFFLFPRLEAALAAAQAMLELGATPRCLEFLDEVALGALPELSRHGAGSAALLFEVDGFDEEGTYRHLEALCALARQFTDMEGVIADTREKRLELWKLRSTTSVRLKDAYAFKCSEDVVVPRSRLLEAITGFKAVASDPDTAISTYGHLGDGNLHVNILAKRTPTPEITRGMISQILKFTVEIGGTISGEHGVGTTKLPYLHLEQRQELRAVQNSIKGVFDPQGLFNPGKAIK